MTSHCRQTGTVPSGFGTAIVASPELRSVPGFGTIGPRNHTRRKRDRSKAAAAMAETAVTPAYISPSISISAAMIATNVANGSTRMTPATDQAPQFRELIA